MHDEKRRRVGRVALAFGSRKAAVEGGIAGDAVRLPGPRELERRRAAEAIAHHHGLLIGILARFFEASEDQRPHTRAILVELRGLRFFGASVGRAVSLAEEI